VGGGGGGVVQFVTFVFVLGYRERKLLFLSEEREACDITNGWRLFGNQREARRRTGCSPARQASLPRCSNLLVI
jgi:hypothetical protein